jgi:uncharacterized protein RhaS with RHS repeats
MTDGTGTTQYSYVPPGSLGALQLQQESSPLAGSGIAYAYDALDRLASHTVQGAGAETFQYDAIGRLVTHANDLGSFTLYLGQTSQIAGRALASSTVATTWSYLNNTGDRRLSADEAVPFEAADHLVDRRRERRVVRGAKRAKFASNTSTSGFCARWCAETLALNF